MSDHQLLEALVVILADYAADQGYLEIGTLRQEVECLTCVKPKMIRAIIIERLCHWIRDLEVPQ